MQGCNRHVWIVNASDPDRIVNPAIVENELSLSYLAHILVLFTSVLRRFSDQCIHGRARTFADVIWGYLIVLLSLQEP